jgi:tRNA threonylcarbamoyladenosine biosynthesis protein TsaE
VGCPPSAVPLFGLRLTHSSEETLRLGTLLGRALLSCAASPSGAAVALSGPLGAGKTCFAKGLALALEIDDEVASPTYTVVCEYEGKPGALPFRHIDAWRISGGADFESAGGAELFCGPALVAVEWPEKIAGFLPDGAVWVEFALRENADERSIVISHKGTKV